MCDEIVFLSPLGSDLVIESDMTEELPSEIVKSIPMKRMGKTYEVASLANYLLSKEASYITGQVIGVNGGLYI